MFQCALRKDGDRVPNEVGNPNLIVAVDHRYRLSVTPDDVPVIVEELRGA